MFELGFVESLTLVEMLIIGFIGSNFTLAGAFLVQCGVRRLGADSTQA